MYYAINDQKWNSLPDELKVIVINACRQNVKETYIQCEWADTEGLEKFREYGTEIVVLPEEFQREVAYATYDFFDKMAADDPLLAKGLESQRYVYKIYQASGGVRTPVFPSYEEYKASP